MLVGTDDAASKPPRGPHGSIYNLRACGVSKQDGRVEEISDKSQSALGYTVTNSEIRFGIYGHQQFSPQAIGRLLKQTRVGGREKRQGRISSRFGSLKAAPSALRASECHEIHLS